MPARRRSDHLSSWRLNVFSVLPSQIQADGETVLDETECMQQAVKSIILSAQEGLRAPGNPSGLIAGTSEWLFPDTGHLVGITSAQISIDRSDAEAFADITEMVVLDLCRLWLQLGRIPKSERLNNGLRQTSRKCFWEKPWDFNAEVASLTIMNSWPPLCERGAWRFNQRTLRRIVALSCSNR